MPIEPPPTPWSLPERKDITEATGDLVGVGADLEAGTLLTAYRRGMFPMPIPHDLRIEVTDLPPIGWWSPILRGVLPLNGMKVSRSLRKSCRRFKVSMDSAFQQVIELCGDPARPNGWIDEDIVAAYLQLFELGWAHSIEVWNVETRQLVGGLYGVAIGGLFAGESMFHLETDASKVALVSLTDKMRAGGFTLLDVQWKTKHLESLGAIELEREAYLEKLSDAIKLPTRILD